MTRTVGAVSDASQAPAFSSKFTCLMRSSVLRRTREVSDDAMMARMKKLAILRPSGRSTMLTTVV